MKPWYFLRLLLYHENLMYSRYNPTWRAKQEKYVYICFTTFLKLPYVCVCVCQLVFCKMSLFLLVESSLSSLPLRLCNSLCCRKTQSGLEALPTVRDGHHVRGCEPCVCMCAGGQQTVKEFWRMSQCASELSVWPCIVRDVGLGVCVCVKWLKCTWCRVARIHASWKHDTVQNLSCIWKIIILVCGLWNIHTNLSLV